MNKALCLARTEIPNGEYVSPCCLDKGHDGLHQGWCLGSRYSWEDNKVYDHGNDEWTEYADQL